MQQLIDGGAERPEVELLASSRSERDPSRLSRWLHSKSLRAFTGLLVAGVVLGHQGQQNHETSQRLVAEQHIAAQPNAFMVSRGAQIRKIAERQNFISRTPTGVDPNGVACKETKLIVPAGQSGLTTNYELSVAWLPRQNGAPQTAPDDVMMLSYVRRGTSQIELSGLTLQKINGSWVETKHYGASGVDSYCGLVPETQIPSTPVTLADLPELRQIFDQPIAMLSNSALPLRVITPDS